MTLWTRASRAVAVQRGQAVLLMLGLVGVLLVGALVLGGIGSALGAKSRHQRAADLAAVSAAAAMSEAYPRLFEPAYLNPGVPNPRHLPLSDYLALARGTAVRAARRNGVGIEPADVTFPERDSFAPVRVAVHVRGEVPLPEALAEGRAPVPVRARAAAELVPSASAGLGMPPYASGGGYSGPLAYRMGKPMRPDVAEAFDRLAAAARSEAGLHLSINSAFR
ncbi:MAG TPA: pilus assembly protein TadG-related protein, partial [Solirubrobacteraceae bacterium]|nr:pilus assembly protein TadG-related protein [Solirubrobacteraceae bacterium]